jgi:hypothetical protein
MATQSYVKISAGDMMLISIKTQMVNQSSMMENKDVIVNLP